MHAFPPSDGVAAVYVTPTIDEARAAESNEHTSILDEDPPPALVATATPALPVATEIEGLDDAPDVVDLLEHAVTDRAPSSRVPAVNIVEARMNCPFSRERHSRRRQGNLTTRP